MTREAERIPGQIFCESEMLELNAGRETTQVTVANLGDRPIQVGSHFHFFEVNRALQFDRDLTFGFRLDIPAGTAVRFEPGDTKEVTLVAIAGNRQIQGLNNLTNGSLDALDVRAKAREQARRLEFMAAGEDPDEN